MLELLVLLSGYKQTICSNEYIQKIIATSHLKELSSNYKMAFLCQHKMSRQTLFVSIFESSHLALKFSLCATVYNCSLHQFVIFNA